MIETPLCNLDLQTILAQLHSNQDFVWLDSADDSGNSIIAFEATDHVVFNNNDQDAFRRFVEPISFSSTQTQTTGFSGGWIGYLSYESFAFNPLIPVQPVLTQQPLAAFKYYENFIAVTPTALILHTKTYAQRDAVLHRLSTITPAESTKNTAPAGLLSSEVIPAPNNESSYAKAFSQIMEDIASGRYFEINYSFELQHTLHRPVDWFEIYLNLRKQARAPMMAFLKFDDLNLLSASPERFFSIHNGVIQTCPIKGTIARRHNSKEDMKQKSTLQNSVKDRAELLMVTDMLRNDLGRICSVGRVTTESLCEILTLPYYHHLVSHIRGELLANTTLFDVFCALFPGGSITGAPKISAMQRILELENRSRGVYTGAIGYISNNGSVDFNIAIRTLVANQNSVTYAIGSGIVSDSTQKSELAECWLKASAFLDLLSQREIINKTAS